MKTSKNKKVIQKYPKSERLRYVVKPILLVYLTRTVVSNWSLALNGHLGVRSLVENCPETAKILRITRKKSAKRRYIPAKICMKTI